MGGQNKQRRFLQSFARDYDVTWKKKNDRSFLCFNVGTIFCVVSSHRRTSAFSLRLRCASVRPTYFRTTALFDRGISCETNPQSSLIVPVFSFFSPVLAPRASCCYYTPSLLLVPLRKGVMRPRRRCRLADPVRLSVYFLNCSMSTRLSFFFPALPPFHLPAATCRDTFQCAVFRCCSAPVAPASADRLANGVLRVSSAVKFPFLPVFL